MKLKYWAFTGWFRSIDMLLRVMHYVISTLSIFSFVNSSIWFETNLFLFILISTIISTICYNRVTKFHDTILEAITSSGICFINPKTGNKSDNLQPTKLNSYDNSIDRWSITNILVIITTLSMYVIITLIYYRIIIDINRIIEVTIYIYIFYYTLMLNWAIFSFFVFYLKKHKNGERRLFLLERYYHLRQTDDGFSDRWGFIIYYDKYAVDLSKKQANNEEEVNMLNMNNEGFNEINDLFESENKSFNKISDSFDNRDDVIEMKSDAINMKNCAINMKNHAINMKNPGFFISDNADERHSTEGSTNKKYKGKYRLRITRQINPKHKPFPSIGIYYVFSTFLFIYFAIFFSKCNREVDGEFLGVECNSNVQ